MRKRSEFIGVLSAYLLSERLSTARMRTSMMTETVAILCVVCVLLVPGQCSTSCTLDEKDPCQCTYQDGGNTWRINIRDYFPYP